MAYTVPTRAQIILHPTGAAANVAAIDAVKRFLHADQRIDQTFEDFIGPRLTGWYGSLYNDNLPASGPIIQIDGIFTKTHSQKTTTVNLTLDVDIPLPTSTQMPHIGWDMMIDKTKITREQKTRAPGGAPTAADQRAQLGRQDDSGHSYVAEGVLRHGRPAAADRKKLAKTAAGGDGVGSMYKFTVNYYKLVDA